MATRSNRQPTGPLVYITLLVGFGVAMMAVKPFWDRTGYDSMRSECLVNLEVIAEQQAAITKSEGRPLACAPHPVEPPGPDGVPWTEVPVCWQRLGFDPRLTLHGRYEVETGATGWTARCGLTVGGVDEVWEATDAVTAHKVGG